MLWQGYALCKATEHPSVIVILCTEKADGATAEAERTPASQQFDMQQSTVSSARMVMYVEVYI